MIDRSPDKILTQNGRRFESLEYAGVSRGTPSFSTLPRIPVIGREMDWGRALKMTVLSGFRPIVTPFRSGIPGSRPPMIDDARVIDFFLDADPGHVRPAAEQCMHCMTNRKGRYQVRACSGSDMRMLQMQIVCEVVVSSECEIIGLTDASAQESRITFVRRTSYIFNPMLKHL